MVISSSGRAAQHQGGALGQYEYHEDKGYYVQTSTEQSYEKFQATYLYRDEDDKWWVSRRTPGEKRGWLRNTRPSQTPPYTGWQYSDGGWQDDKNLTVTPGPHPPLPKQFKVKATGAAAEKWPEALGVFTKTQRWWFGRPMYVNKVGQLLYQGAKDFGWVIGPESGHYAALRGSRARHSPTEEDSWRYWTWSEWKPASVTVTSSD